MNPQAGKIDQALYVGEKERQRARGTTRDEWTGGRADIVGACSETTRRIERSNANNTTRTHTQKLSNLKKSKEKIDDN